jgi:hypothetical protein
MVLLLFGDKTFDHLHPEYPNRHCTYSLFFCTFKINVWRFIIKSVSATSVLVLTDMSNTWRLRCSWINPGEGLVLAIR